MVYLRSIPLCIKRSRQLLNHKEANAEDEEEKKLSPKALKRLKYKMLAEIINWVDTKYAGMIMHCEEPSEAWSIIRSHVQGQSIYVKHDLLNEMDNFQLQKGVSVSQNLERFETIRSQLLSLDVSQDENASARKLLNSLSSPFESLRFDLTREAVNNNQGKYDLNQVLNTVQMKAKSLELWNKTPNNSGGGIALAASTPVVCEYCKFKNHTKQECRKRKRDLAASAKTAKPDADNINSSPDTEKGAAWSACAITAKSCITIIEPVPTPSRDYDCRQP